MHGRLERARAHVENEPLRSGGSQTSERSGRSGLREHALAERAYKLGVERSAATRARMLEEEVAAGELDNRKFWAAKFQAVYRRFVARIEYMEKRRHGRMYSEMRRRPRSAIGRISSRR